MENHNASATSRVIVDIRGGERFKKLREGVKHECENFEL
jgi:hypothetical protein